MVSNKSIKILYFGFKTVLLKCDNFADFNLKSPLVLQITGIRLKELF